ncbi:MAG: hypothetical protein RSF73_09165 [Ruthenibacterium sp.]
MLNKVLTRLKNHDPKTWFLCIICAIVALIALFLVFSTEAGTITVAAVTLLCIFGHVKHLEAQEIVKQQRRDMLENRKHLMADFIWFFVCTYAHQLSLPIEPYLTHSNICRCATAAEIQPAVIAVKFELPRDKFFDDTDARDIGITGSLLSRAAVDYCLQQNMPTKAFDSGFDFIDCDCITVTPYSVDITLILLDNWSAISRKEHIIMAKRQQAQTALPTIEDELKIEHDCDVFL